MNYNSLISFCCLVHLDSEIKIYKSFRKQLAIDKRSEPRIGERVPYVVVHGAPGTPLYQLIRHPKDVINDINSKLNGTYYVTKMILPALDRMMSLLGVDVFQWYQQLPRELRICFKLDDSQEMVQRKNKKVSFIK